MFRSLPEAFEISKFFPPPSFHVNSHTAHLWLLCSGSALCVPPMLREDRSRQGHAQHAHAEVEPGVHMG